MHAPLLWIHSWTRWIVVLGGLLFWGYCVWGWMRARKWGGRENAFVWAFSQALGYQVLFGLALYLGSSPFIKLAIAHPELIFKDALIEFWVTRHGPTMLLALGVFHGGRRLAQRAPLTQRFRSYALTFTAMLGLIASAFPWQWLAYGRPWFRWSF